MLMITLLDRETEETVYSAKQAVEHGHTNQSFKIPGEKLNAGKYRLKVSLGEDLVAEDEFEVR